MYIFFKTTLQKNIRQNRNMFIIHDLIQYYLNFMKMILYICINRDQKIIYQNVHSANLLLLELWDLSSSSDCIFYIVHTFLVKKNTKLDFEVHVSEWTLDL